LYIVYYTYIPNLKISSASRLTATFYAFSLPKQMVKYWWKTLSNWAPRKKMPRQKK